MMEGGEQRRVERDMAWQQGIIFLLQEIFAHCGCDAAAQTKDAHAEASARNQLLTLVALGIYLKIALHV